MIDRLPDVAGGKKGGVWCVFFGGAFLRAKMGGGGVFRLKMGVEVAIRGGYSGISGRKSR
jgi:hypothetical protein